jgi:nicotinic acid mononucleotide adenylyltransferase
MNLHGFLEMDPNIDIITQSHSNTYIITTDKGNNKNNKNTDLTNLRYIQHYNPITNDITSTVVEKKIREKDKKMELKDNGIRIKISEEYEIIDYAFMEQWNKIINNIHTNHNRKTNKIGLNRNKFRTSYTSTDKSSLYYGLSIDTTHVIETEYYDNGNHTYNCRFELELEITNLEYHMEYPEMFITGLKDLYAMLKHIKSIHYNKPNAGIYFGSFDPIHENHFKLANRTMETQKLDYLFWVPNTPNTLKGKTYLEMEHRVNMISLKIGKNNIIKLPNITTLLILLIFYNKYSNYYK